MKTVIETKGGYETTTCYCDCGNELNSDKEQEDKMCEECI